MSAISAHADSASTSSLTLSPLVVTATSTEQNQADSLVSVTVIDTDSVKKQQPQELSELLASQPGIDIVTNGGYGKSTSIYTRGSSSTGTKLLIDGVPIQSHSTGSSSWQYLPLSQVERIEIVRGPKSSLYGSSAAGGVIQVFLSETGDSEAGDEPQASIAFGGGSFHTRQANASASGSSGNASYLLSVGTFDTDGTEVKENAGDMGYSNDNILSRLGYEFDNGAYAKALIMRAEGQSDYTTSAGRLRSNDYVNQVIALTGGIDLTADWQSEIQLRESRDDSDVLNDKGIKTNSYFYSRSRGVRWSNTLSQGSHELVFGAEHTQDDFEGSYTKERTSKSVFAQSLSQFGQASAQLNIRADHYDEYDTQTTGGVALGYQVDAVHSVRTSWRTSFTAPTFNSMNAQEWGYTLSNEIRPETSKSFEVGVRGDYGDGYWDLAIYQADYQDLIAWSASTVGNIESARVRGLELTTGLSIDQWSFGLVATMMDTENLSDGAEKGNRLTRRAHKSARIDVDRHFEKTALGFTVASYGERYDDSKNQDLLSGYGVLNLRASYDFARDWKAELSVKNALDKEYQTAKGYLNPGRGVFLTFNYTAF
ncbi:TonB-dependent receptor [Marinomonas sp. M1K-6]|uniref:TonB-dependent receptor n=1 Tax=Marinomonas profundi TaxID=2726122 RepID=A0A847QYG5_9GAMM|nr:TonB-dependent receptor [Marinomonas profundi]NLQ17979.1 TonB-dependent receptor [Marinomonas profundi]UDV01705.1 TonB-dependent receptor [Marinomonas profundi]